VWTIPTYAYTEDGNNAYSSTDGAEQKYGGWNFTTSDIPPGSTITKVEVGCKHYEVDPTGYYQYTDLKYVNSAGSSTTIDLTKRSSLTWDYWDITSYESSWDLTKLNNADVRIICKLVSASTGGCLFKHGDMRPFTLCRDKSGLLIKPIDELVEGETLIVWSEETNGFLEAKAAKIEKFEGYQEFIKIVLRKVRVPSIKIAGEFVEYQPYIVVTANQPLFLFKKPYPTAPNYAGPYRLKAIELWQRAIAGEQFWIGCFLNWNILMMPIERVEYIETFAESYKIAVNKPQAHIFAETLTLDDIALWTKHGYSFREIPKISNLLWIIAKETSYVDAICLRVTFNPPATGVTRLIGDSLAEAVVTA
jgi:hypothetical protein